MGRIRGVHRENASFGRGSGGKGEGAHPLHAIEAEARSAVPDREGGTAHRVAVGAEAAARGANQGDREAGSYEATHFGIRPLHLEARLEASRREAAVASTPACRPLRRRGVKVRRRAMQRRRIWLLSASCRGGPSPGRCCDSRGIRVGDADIKDRRGASGPESVDSDVAAEFWGGLGRLAPAACAS
ncbi:hypothetical protein MHU86_8394 [Fragilaria crotonensis]|nr:hypothetical protein MHU86_8394 [Fragilaria crotonensis]